MTDLKEKPKTDLTNRIEDNSIKGWLNSNGNALSRIGVYGANIAVNLFSRIHNPATLIGNAYGAIGFGLLDIILRKQKSLRESRGNRLFKTGFSLVYIGACAYDVVSALDSALEGGNYWANLTELVFDASIAYQLDKDSDRLYEKLNSGTEKDTKKGVKDDLKGLFEDIKKKFGKGLENKVSGTKGLEGKDVSKNFKEYLSNFGKGALMSIGYGLGTGYGFGKGAFEKLKENYSIYKTKLKEKEAIKNRAKRIKKIRKDRIIQENRRFSEPEKVSFKDKKEILEYCGKNPIFMRGYEIENEYTKFKQKPIKEQIQIITNERNSLKEEFKQMRIAPWSKRFWNSSEISYTKKSLKQIEEILRKLDIEEKNPPRAPALQKYFDKKGGENDEKQNS